MKMNPFEIAFEQYQELTEKTLTTSDVQEKNLLFARRINLLGVLDFLLSEHRDHDLIRTQ
jgi:hypothetical protein